MSGSLVHVFVLESLIKLSQNCHIFPVSPGVQHLHGGVGGPVVVTPPTHPDARVEAAVNLIIIANWTQFPRLSPGDPGQVAGTGQAREAHPGLGGRAQLQGLGGVQLGAAQHSVQSTVNHTGAVIPANLGNNNI